MCIPQCPPPCFLHRLSCLKILKAEFLFIYEWFVLSAIHRSISRPKLIFVLKNFTDYQNYIAIKLQLDLKQYRHGSARIFCLISRGQSKMLVNTTCFPLSCFQYGVDLLMRIEPRTFVQSSNPRCSYILFWNRISLTRLALSGLLPQPARKAGLREHVTTPGSWRAFCTAIWSSVKRFSLVSHAA